MATITQGQIVAGEVWAAALDTRPEQSQEGDELMIATSSSEKNLVAAEVLSIAHQDAQGAYGDLSGFKITLFRCPDGWHVDYDIVEPLAAGGGSHYVIDPVTGVILTRRYEQ